MLRVGKNVLCMCACVGLLGVWLEKYRLFYVALTLCFTVSFVGGWLNESFGLGLRYQKPWFGPGLGGGCQGEGKANLYLWLLDSSCTLLHGDASLPLSASMSCGASQTQTAATVSNYPPAFLLGCRVTCVSLCFFAKDLIGLQRAGGSSFWHREGIGYC